MLYCNGVSYPSLASRAISVAVEPLKALGPIAVSNSSVDGEAIRCSPVERDMEHETWKGTLDHVREGKVCLRQHDRRGPSLYVIIPAMQHGGKSAGGVVGVADCHPMRQGALIGGEALVVNVVDSGSCANGDDPRCFPTGFLTPVP